MSKKPDFLLLEIVAVELLNLAARAAHHDVFEDPLAQLARVLLDRGNVITGIPMDLAN